MRSPVKSSILTKTVSLIAILTLPVSVHADQFHPQPMSAAGGKITISVLPHQGYSGTITFAASNVVSGTDAYLQGNAEPLPIIGSPPGASITLYSILLNFDPRYTAQFVTSGTSMINLTLPSSVDTAKPINVYETQFNTAPPAKFVWSGPYRGAVSGKTCSFSLPTLSFPGDSVVVFDVTQ